MLYSVRRSRALFLLLLPLLSPVAVGQDPGPVDLGAAAEPGLHSFFGKAELGLKEIDGVPFEFKEAMVRLRPGNKKSVEFPATTAAGIHFLHFTENAGDEVGAYTLVYADGIREDIALRNGLNIQDWWKPGTMAFAALAFKDSFDPKNTPPAIGYWRFSVRNPHPEKPLAGLEFTNSDASININLIAATLTAECGDKVGTVPVWVVGMDEEQFFLAVLNQPDSPAGKAKACAQLAKVGTVKCVPALAECLRDEKLSHAARLALAAMVYPEAKAALRDALPAATGQAKAGIIESLGTLRNPDDAALLAPFLKDPDPQVAMSAALALGRIAAPACIEPLKRASIFSTGRLQMAAKDALLRCGEALCGTDDKAAFALYKDLWIRWSDEHAVATAAYSGMLRSGGSLTDMLITNALLQSDNQALWEAALPAVRENAGPEITGECGGLLRSVPRGVLPGLIEALAQRGDKAIAPVLAPLVGDADADISLATIKALALVGDGSSVPVLVSAAAHGAEPNSSAAVQTLAQINDPEVSATLLARLQGADAAETAVVAKVMGQRRDEAVVPALQRLVQSPDAGIRAAAAQALGEVGTAADAGLLCGAIEGAEDDKGRMAAQRALVALGRRLEAPDPFADSVLAGLKQGNTASRCALLDACGSMNNEKLMQALDGAAHGSDAAEKDAAIRALAASDSPGALPYLMSLLGNGADPDYRVLVFRGIARLAAKKDMDTALREETLTRALALAELPEEKRLLLGPLGTCRSMAALKTVEGYLDSADVAAEASVAWGQIARELVKTNRDEIAAVAPKAIAAAQKAELPKAAMQPLADVGKALNAVAVSGDAIRFEHLVIDREFRSEGVAVADVNRDGVSDILVGDVWYEAPDWKAHEIRAPEKYDPATAYSRAFACFPADVDKDGWPDLIVVGFPGAPAYWYRNPGTEPGHWQEYLLATEACGETPVYGDLAGDGKPVPVFAMSSRITWFRPGQDKTTPWLPHSMSHTLEAFAKFGHGLGLGDVNGDGRTDVLITEGWWEGPADPTRPDWSFHRDKLGPDCATMLVYDVNGDGRNDIITSSAHEYGMWWFEQGEEKDGTAFTKHDIDKSVSETHALILADLNNDGLQDLVTGKRYFAHGEHDPGALEPSELFWLELQRPEPGRVEYKKRLIDSDSGVGTQFEVCDFNEDGLQDVVVSNKKGVHVFLQKRDK